LGVRKYKKMMKKNDIGDMIFHAGIEETATGIVTGGYCS